MRHRLGRTGHGPAAGSRGHQRAHSLVEWMLAVSAIAIFLILIVTVLGNTVNNAFSNVSNGLTRH
jgi:Flp pilus assembly pilin Flp